MKPFDFNPTFLLSIVNEQFYSVPQYQRSYAWTSEMIEEFWGDMERAISDDREHFMGNIVLSAETDDGTQSIVDGQQRIVTTTILLSALRDSFKESGDETTAESIGRHVRQHDVMTFADLPRVRMNPDDNPFYFKRIVEGSLTPPEIESHYLMDDAYKFFMDRLSAVKEANPSDWKQRFSLFHLLSRKAGARCCCEGTKRCGRFYNI